LLAIMRYYNWMSLLGMLALLTACTSHETSGVQWRGQFFRQVYSLQALPTAIQNSLGVGRPGMEGIADRDGKFNPTDVVDSALPMRRFALAGLSSNAALVAIEHGGRGYNVQILLIPLASIDTEPKETWTLFEAPKSLRELIDKLESEHHG
jgi:hypothetical protein